MTRIYRSTEGNGHAIGSEYYPFQGLDLPMHAAEDNSRWPDWMLMANLCANIVRKTRERDPESGIRMRPVGEIKWPGVTPWGTPLGAVARRELGMPARDGWEQAHDSWHEGDQVDYSAGGRRTRKSVHDPV